MSDTILETPEVLEEMDEFIYQFQRIAENIGLGDFDRALGIIIMHISPALNGKGIPELNAHFAEFYGDDDEF
jgi:hypothetical protein